jgi:NAD(P)-dependent dehydrogenase (short-subunit alcohol dehydrogenase family)
MASARTTLTDRRAGWPSSPGANRGSDAATARAPALSGAIVVLAARAETDLVSVARQISEGGGRAFPRVADVTGPASIERLRPDTVATQAGWTSHSTADQTSRRPVHHTRIGVP